MPPVLVAMAVVHAPAVAQPMPVALPLPMDVEEGPPDWEFEVPDQEAMRRYLHEQEAMLGQQQQPDEIEQIAQTVQAKGGGKSRGNETRILRDQMRFALADQKVLACM